jgi:hypothetical protein
MDHAEVERMQTVDRYLLGGLSSSEREEFEEHFFSCPVCAEDLKTGASFVDNARAALEEEPDRPSSPNPVRAPVWWRSGLVAGLLLASNLLFVGIVVYQRNQALDATAPRAVPVAMARAMRGPAALNFSKRIPEVTVSIQEDWPDTFPLYVCEIKDQARGSAQPVLDPFVSGHGPFLVSIHTARVDKGVYDLIVYGTKDPAGASGRAEVARFAVTITD